jgi:hypothetical protein
MRRLGWAIGVVGVGVTAALLALGASSAGGDEPLLGRALADRLGLELHPTASAHSTCEPGWWWFTEVEDGRGYCITRDDAPDEREMILLSCRLRGTEPTPLDERYAQLWMELHLLSNSSNPGDELRSYEVSRELRAVHAQGGGRC